MNIAQKKSQGIPPEATPRRATKRITAAAIIAPVFALTAAGAASAAAPAAAYAGTAPTAHASKATASDGYRGRLVLVTALRTLPNRAAVTAELAADGFASHDEQAVNANTWHCQADFAAMHRHVRAVNLGTPEHQGSRHLGSNVAGTARIVRWFSELTR